MHISENLILADLGEKCILFAHTKKHTTDQENDRGNIFFRSKMGDLANCRFLIVTDGGSPTPEQRRQTQKEFGDSLKKVRTAVVSTSIGMRFVVSSLCLVVGNIRSFNSTQLHDALLYLGFDRAGQDRIHTSMLNVIKQIPRGQFLTMDALLGNKLTR